MECEPNWEMFASNSVILPQLPTCLLAGLPSPSLPRFLLFSFSVPSVRSCSHIVSEGRVLRLFPPNAGQLKIQAEGFQHKTSFVLWERLTLEPSLKSSLADICVKHCQSLVGLQESFLMEIKSEPKGADSWPIWPSWPRPQQSSLGDCCCQLVTQLNSAARARPISAY